MKYCPHCKQEQPLHTFSPKASYCKTCSTTYARERANQRQQHPQRLCSQCKQWKKSKAFPSGYSAYCRSCYNTYRYERSGQKHYAKNIEDYLLQRILQKENGCWEWQGFKDDNGYGKGAFQGLEFRANRMSYTLFIGPVPPHLFICHVCDNPPCINPEHLFLGTPSDNLLDAIQKDRRSYFQRKRTTTEDQQHIRELRTEGWSYKKIAKHLKIPYSTVYYTINKK